MKSPGPIPAWVNALPAPGDGRTVKGSVCPLYPNEVPPCQLPSPATLAPPSPSMAPVPSQLSWATLPFLSTYSVKFSPFLCLFLGVVCQRLNLSSTWVRTYSPTVAIGSAMARLRVGYEG